MIFKPHEIRHIAKKLDHDALGIFPFDTLFGLTCTLNESNMNRLYTLKKRPQNFGCIVIIPNLSFLPRLTQPLSPFQSQKIQSFWPGPVTLIFKKHTKLPKFITRGKNTIAIRLPHFLPLNYLLNTLNQPIFSTSVNRSGEPAASTPESFPSNILEGVDFSYTSLSPPLNTASRIIDISQDNITVLR